MVTSLFVYGDIILSEFLIMDYGSPNANGWFLRGTDPHTLTTHGLNMNALYANQEAADMTLLTDLRADLKIELPFGRINTKGYNIMTRVFEIGGGCSGSNCPNVEHEVDGSVIECSSFKIDGTPGVNTFDGNFKIQCSTLDLGGNEVDSVYIFDYGIFVSFFGVRFGGGTIGHLTIDIDEPVSITNGGEILSDIEIKQVSLIEFKTLGENSTLTIGGMVSMPDNLGCELFTPLTKRGTGVYQFIKNSGNIFFDNTLINGLSTGGGADFYASQSIVLQNTQDWIVTPTNSRKYFWIGGDGLWNDPANWSFDSGGPPTVDGCLPTLKDLVIVDNASFTGDNQKIELPEGAQAFCEFLDWNANNYNNNGLDFSYSNLSTSGGATLNILTGLSLNSSAVVIPGNNNTIQFWGSNAFLNTSNRTLPNVRVENTNTNLSLSSALICQDLILESGVFRSQGNKIIADEVRVTSNGDLTQFCELTNSVITVNGPFNLRSTVGSQVSMDATGASIKCKNFDSPDGDVSEIILTNTSSIDGPRRVHNIDRLILKGGAVRMGFQGSTMGEVSVKELIFDSPSADLFLRDVDGLRITESITNLAGLGPKIEAFSSVSVGLVIPRNICVSGPLGFENVEVADDFVLNAPDGIDLGDNVGVDFTSYIDNGKLYWIGGAGEWQDVENWSFGSGACPTISASPSSYNELIFDDNSFMPNENEITFSQDEIANRLTFTNSTIEGIISTPGIFKIKDIRIDGGQAKFRNEDIQIERSVELTSNVEVVNQGSLTIQEILFEIGKIPSQMTSSTMKVDGTSTFVGIKANLNVAGHGTGVTANTVDFDPNATIQLTNMKLEVSPSSFGQAQNDMTFNFNGAFFQTILLENDQGPLQKFRLVSDLITQNLNMKFGILEIAAGQMLRIDQ